jgi:flagellar motor switch protein FliG
MTSNISPLRKAAILLQSLDAGTADGLLRLMTPEERERAERELEELGEIDPDIRERVVAEFRCHGDSPRAFDNNGIELDDSLAQKISVGTTAIESSSARHSETPPFRFLHEAEADTVVQFLQHERPQVVALVMSHLAPHQAAQLLERFEPNLQGQILHCVSRLDETDPAILHDLEDHLRSQLQDHIRLRKCQAAGAAAVRAILTAVDPRKQSILMQSIAERDRPLADRLRHPRSNMCKGEFSELRGCDEDSSLDPSSFDQMYHLTDEELRSLASRAPAETVVVALAGAEAPLVERVLKCVSPKQSKLLSRALKHLGPTKLRDVEEAQLMLGRIAVEIHSHSKSRSQARSRRAVQA